ncbi:hypothetical protein FM102_08160 [Corynebacterium glutamicum]|uniref:Uncharacterized protein n=1 Tax=Corynebacterium glutamicum (strain R) TaxID=340322 RepID=A0AB72VCY3_CORGB|nr:hypothetical protein C624_11290 [Corynebacterium glutamicum SCgG1]AGN22854.1 hypothetical protein C629_11300 [Corynebacterium glutamicum SCgG2]ANR63173.1 hypothetical protein C628_11255 [[Brevibacterium] flavum ZL-1]ANR66179.1 hypothetical protein C627_11150 [Corynebacterium glutamicum ZL-6]EGV40343.1 hypothetical protein CgS9114_09171 [Corynebacterium glutamicum S9114]EOA63341.1 hypothetical protein J433_14497 [Corynebacterium glutamicum MT]EPP39932.1 hypothetical protein A583_10828 [Cory
MMNAHDFDAQVEYLNQIFEVSEERILHDDILLHITSS